jgi:hypothetical protein
VDAQLQAFRIAGLADAKEMVGRTIVLDGVTYTGIRSELRVEPGQQGDVAMRKKRAFSFHLDRAQMPKIPRDGICLVDDEGLTYKIDSKRTTVLSVRLYCIQATT